MKMQQITGKYPLTGTAAGEPKIDRKYVHKARDENVVIGRIHRLNSPGNNVFECNMVFDHTLPFFFEHYLDHLPGLLLVEGARQMGTAVSHLYYDIDLRHVFLLAFINVSFISFIELHSKVTLCMTMNTPAADVGKAGRKVFHCNVAAIQDGIVKAEMESRWRCIPRKAISRMRPTMMVPA
ncbi:MAG: hypothetical protein GXO94_09775 [Nitrospirae bacterium]|nr:hypothetical protein [Nitrospirota bacterium]